MEPRIPEKNKKAGVCYAWTDDGLELPVIAIALNAARHTHGRADSNSPIPPSLRHPPTPHHVSANPLIRSPPQEQSHAALPLARCRSLFFARRRVQ